MRIDTSLLDNRLPVVDMQHLSTYSSLACAFYNDWLQNSLRSAAVILNYCLSFSSNC